MSTTQTVTPVKTVKKVSDYQRKVLDVNKGLKTERKSLGGCIKTLLMFSKEIGLSKGDQTALRFIQKDSAAFGQFKKHVRTGQYKGKSTGTYSPFYVLQALYKAGKPAKEVTKKAPKKNLTPINSVEMPKKSVKELRSIAKQKNVKGYSKMKKAELIKAIV